MFPKNITTNATHAVDVLLVGTLRSQGALIASEANNFANLPASTEVIVTASGGTFLGSAFATTRGPGTGEQNNATGAQYAIRTDNTGAVDRIQVIQSRPNGSIQGAAVAAAPFNPGSGPNMAAVGQTILFDAATMTAAFGIQAPAITGLSTVTLRAVDLQAPFSGAAAGTDGIYEAEGGSCSVYVGAGTGIKVELVSAPPNQTITITAVPGTVLPFSVRKIYTTDTATTATQIIALY